MKSKTQTPTKKKYTLNNMGNKVYPVTIKIKRVYKHQPLKLDSKDETEVYQ